MMLARRSVLAAPLLLAPARRARKDEPVTTYRPLQSVKVTAAADATGKNTGNWTNAFTAQQLPNVNTYEVYHMTVTAAPVFAAAQVVIRGQVWSTLTADSNGQNEWDPEQPAYLNDGDEMYFFWAVAASGTTPPVATAWLRFDADLPQNKYIG